MPYPVVYDVLMRTEIEARDELDALAKVESYIREMGISKAGLQSAFEVIRDDNAHPPKDEISRHTNGFVIFDSEQKNSLIDAIAKALDAAAEGDPSLGNKLIGALSGQFEYLRNSTLAGVRV